MKTTTTLQQKQAAKIAALETELSLQTKFNELTNGIAPSIVSPDINPFAVFYPKSKEEFLQILNSLQPNGELFNLTFAGRDPIPTASPYSIHYGGKHSSPNYMDVTVKFKHSICPVWVKMPEDVKKVKFSVARLRGDHKGFGNYETMYTLHANEKTSLQTYYGENKVMYAANESEVAEFLNIIFS